MPGNYDWSKTIASKSMAEHTSLKFQTNAGSKGRSAQSSSLIQFIGVETSTSFLNRCPSSMCPLTSGTKKSCQIISGTNIFAWVNDNWFLCLILFGTFTLN